MWTSRSPSCPPVFQDVGKLEDAQNRLAVKRLIKEIGKPRNYGLTDEERAAEERRAAEELLAKEAREAAERQRLEASEAAEKAARWEQWVRGTRGGLSHRGPPDEFGLHCRLYPVSGEARGLVLSYK